MPLPSHLVELFSAQAWYLHQPIYDRLTAILVAHQAGAKDALRADASIMTADCGDDEDLPDGGEEIGDVMIADGIALIDVRGVLAEHADQVNGSCQPTGRSYESITAQITAANDDPDVRAIILRLQTPGGSAVGCQECHDAIRQSATPVHGLISGYAYSAGYYLASACATITVSSRAAGLGSIGTIMSYWHREANEDDAKRGWRPITVRSGPHKAPGQSGEKIDENTLAELQRTVDAYATAFYDAVSAGRGLSKEDGKKLFTGRTWLAGDSDAAALYDAVGDLATLADALGENSDQPTLTPAARPIKENAMPFGKKKPADQPEKSAKDDTKTPPHKPATEGLTKAEYARLLQAYSDQAELLDELDNKGLDASAIEARLATAAVTTIRDNYQAAIEEKDAEIEKLKNDLEQARNFTESSKDNPDPGADAKDDVAPAKLGANASDAQIDAAWSAMSQDKRAHFLDDKGAFAFAVRNPEKVS